MSVLQLTKLLIIVFTLTFLTACGTEDPTNDASQNDSQPLVDPKPQENQPQENRPQHKKISHLLLGTGSVQGVYFPIGGVICRLVNRNQHLHRIRCSLESTGGSISNLRQLRDGNFDLVFAQSDWQFNAYHGKSTFEKDGANTNLRAVFALEPDPLALFVKADSEIEEFDQLADKRVSFGYTRSLQHRIMDDYLEIKQWSSDKFGEMVPMSDAKQVTKLCDGELDAILLLASSIKDRLDNRAQECELKLVPLDDEFVAQAIEKYPYYRKGKVLTAMLNDEIKEAMSFGLGATFVADESTSPKAIYHVVKEVVENFNDFKSLHPSLADIDRRDLPYAGISIPLHPGAIRYYREARLLKR